MFHALAVVALVAAFGRRTAPRPGPGVKVFADAPMVGFCSFAKAGNQFVDVATGRVLSLAEAQARAQAEDCGKDLF